MTTTKKKSVPADPLVAAVPIMIDGKPFAAGEKITRVTKDQLDRAVVDKRVIRKSVFDAIAEGVPAPELGGHLSPDGEIDQNHAATRDDGNDEDDDDTSDTGDAGSGDNEGSTE